MGFDLFGINNNNESKVAKIEKDFRVTVIAIKNKVKDGVIAKTEANIQIANIETVAIRNLEKIGVLTYEKKQQADKEAFAKATLEEKVNIIAERLGLKDTTVIREETK